MATPTTERPAASGERSLPRLQQRYRDEIAPALRDEFKIKNVMQIPGLVKIVVNMGVGEAARDSKLIDGAVRDLATITGQKPVDLHNVLDLELVTQGGRDLVAVALLEPGQAPLAARHWTLSRRSRH